MDLSKKRELLSQQMKENLDLLGNSLNALEYSYNKCRKIGIKESYTPDELESLEALTSRFARTSDILTQKVFKTLFFLIQEEPQTFIDGANLLEKIEIVNNANQILNIRELRNEIAHEYKENNLAVLFNDALDYIPQLIEVIKNTNAYINNKKLT